MNGVTVFFLVLGVLCFGFLAFLAYTFYARKKLEKRLLEALQVVHQFETHFIQWMADSDVTIERAIQTINSVRAEYNMLCENSGFSKYTIPLLTPETLKSIT